MITLSSQHTHVISAIANAIDAWAANHPQPDTPFVMIGHAPYTPRSFAAAYRTGDPLAVSLIDIGVRDEGLDHLIATLRGPEPPLLPAA